MDVENRRKAEQAVRDLLAAFNIRRRPGMEETPARVVKMYEEVWAGEQHSNEELAAMYGKTFLTDTYGQEDENNGMVVVKDIEAFSYCEHHLALIYDMKVSVAYFPSGRVIGLSKIARIVDMCCKRLQLQERIGQDIVDVMRRIVGPDVCVRIEASHSCMTARGIRKPGGRTVTFAKGGAFQEWPDLFQEFLQAVDG